MAANGRFRTSVFGGYNCNDVITFITAENRRFQTEKAGLESRIAELEAALARAEGAARSQEDAARRAEEAEAALTAKEGLLDGILAENAALKAQLAQTEQKYGELSRACEDLGAEKQYLVDLEIAARRRADAVSQASERRVEQITEVVRDRVDRAADMLGSFSEDAGGKVSEALRVMGEYTEMLRGLNQSFADTRREMLASVEEIRAVGLLGEGEQTDGEREDG